MASAWPTTETVSSIAEVNSLIIWTPSGSVVIQVKAWLRRECRAKSNLNTISGRRMWYSRKQTRSSLTTMGRVFTHSQSAPCVVGPTAFELAPRSRQGQVEAILVVRPSFWKSEKA